MNSVKDSSKTMIDTVNTVNVNTKILIDLVTKLTMIQPKEILNNVIEAKKNDNGLVLMEDNDDSSDEDEKRRAKNQNERRNPITQSLPKVSDNDEDIENDIESIEEANKYKAFEKIMLYKVNDIVNNLKGEIVDLKKRIIKL